MSPIIGSDLYIGKLIE